MPELPKPYRVTLLRKNRIIQIVVAADSQRDALDSVTGFMKDIQPIYGKRIRLFADRVRSTDVRAQPATI